MALLRTFFAVALMGVVAGLASATAEDRGPITRQLVTIVREADVRPVTTTLARLGGLPDFDLEGKELEALGRETGLVGDPIARAVLASVKKMSKRGDLIRIESRGDQTIPLGDEKDPTAWLHLAAVTTLRVRTRTLAPSHVESTVDEVQGIKVGTKGGGAAAKLKRFTVVRKGTREVLDVQASIGPIGITKQGIELREVVETPNPRTSSSRSSGLTANLPGP